MKCYPKVNPHNMELIDEYKNIIKENYDDYATIFVGCILLKIGEGGATDESMFVAYLTGIEVIKKK